MAVFMSDCNGDRIAFVLNYCTTEILTVGQELSEGLYFMELYRTANHIQIMLMDQGNEKLNGLWHQRLGHNSLEYLQKTLPLVYGVPKMSVRNIAHYEPCGEGTSTRAPRLPITESNVTDFLELVHSDVLRVVDVESLSRLRYFSSLYYEKSRMSAIRVFRDETQV